MTEDQLLNLVAGDIIHEFRNESLGVHSIDYCRHWIIDYKIDKYVAHGVFFLSDEDHYFIGRWFRHEDLDQLHLLEECPLRPTSPD